MTLLGIQLCFTFNAYENTQEIHNASMSTTIVHIQSHVSNVMLTCTCPMYWETGISSTVCSLGSCCSLIFSHTVHVQYSPLKNNGCVLLREEETGQILAQEADDR